MCWKVWTRGRCHADNSEPARCICEAAATEGTGHAQGEDDVLQSRIDHIALKIARRAHKLYRRRRKSDSERYFTALDLRARDPVLDSVEARLQLDFAVIQKLKAAGYVVGGSRTQAPACMLDVEDEGTELGCTSKCCLLTWCCIPITCAVGVSEMRDRETTTDVQLARQY